MVVTGDLASSWTNAVATSTTSRLTIICHKGLLGIALTFLPGSVTIAGDAALTHIKTVFSHNSP